MWVSDAFLFGPEDLLALLHHGLGPREENDCFLQPVLVLDVVLYVQNFDVYCRFEG